MTGHDAGAQQEAGSRVTRESRAGDGSRDGGWGQAGDGRGVPPSVTPGGVERACAVRLSARVHTYTRRTEARGTVEAVGGRTWEVRRRSCGGCLGGGGEAKRVDT